MHILAVAGSLRVGSSNDQVVRVLAAAAADGVTVDVFDGLGELPHFNPDLDGEGAVPPPPVAGWRARLGAADAVVISSPEYAHGVPGVLKDALDWIVSSGELTDKPIALLVTPSRAVYARRHLTDTLTVMGGRVLELPVPSSAAEHAAIFAALAAAREQLLRANADNGG